MFLFGTGMLGDVGYGSVPTRMPCTIGWDARKSWDAVVSSCVCFLQHGKHLLLPTHYSWRLAQGDLLRLWMWRTPRHAAAPTVTVTFEMQAGAAADSVVPDLQQHAYSKTLRTSTRITIPSSTRQETRRDKTRGELLSHQPPDRHRAAHPVSSTDVLLPSPSSLIGRAARLI